MAAGTLDVDRQNLRNAVDTPRYRIIFTPNVGLDHGLQRHVEVVGDEPLFEYLLSLQERSVPLEWRTQRVREWMSAIQMNGHLLIDDFRIDENEYKMFRAVSEKVVPFRRLLS